MPCQEKQHVSGTVRSTSAAQPSYVLAVERPEENLNYDFYHKSGIF